MNSLYERNQSKLKELQICVQALKKRTEHLEKSIGEMESGRKKKKKRRTAAEIEKKFKVESVIILVSVPKLREDLRVWRFIKFAYKV